MGWGGEEEGGIGGDGRKEEEGIILKLSITAVDKLRKLEWLPPRLPSLRPLQVFTVNITMTTSRGRGWRGKGGGGGGGGGEVRGSLLSKINRFLIESWTRWLPTRRCIDAGYPARRLGRLNDVVPNESSGLINRIWNKRWAIFFICLLFVHFPTRLMEYFVAVNIIFILMVFFLNFIYHFYGSWINPPVQRCGDMKRKEEVGLPRNQLCSFCFYSLAYFFIYFFRSGPGKTCSCHQFRSG